MATPPAHVGASPWLVSDIALCEDGSFPVDALVPGYEVETRKVDEIRLLSVLPYPKVIWDRQEWLQYLRGKYPKVAVMSPLINAGMRRHLTRTKDKPPLFVTLLENKCTGLWKQEVTAFWSESTISKKRLEEKRKERIVDLKSQGYMVIPVTLTTAYAMSGTWENKENIFPWEYPFVNWDEYRGTLSEEEMARVVPGKGGDLDKNYLFDTF